MTSLVKSIKLLCREQTSEYITNSENGPIRLPASLTSLNSPPLVLSERFCYRRNSDFLALKRSCCCCLAFYHLGCRFWSHVAGTRGANLTARCRKIATAISWQRVLGHLMLKHRRLGREPSSLGQVRVLSCAEGVGPSIGEHHRTQHLAPRSGQAPGLGRD